MDVCDQLFAFGFYGHIRVFKTVSDTLRRFLIDAKRLDLCMISKDILQFHKSAAKVKKIKRVRIPSLVLGFDRLFVQPFVQFLLILYNWQWVQIVSLATFVSISPISSNNLWNPPFQSVKPTPDSACPSPTVRNCCCRRRLQWPFGAGGGLASAIEIGAGASERRPLCHSALSLHFVSYEPRTRPFSLAGAIREAGEVLLPTARLFLMERRRRRAWHIRRVKHEAVKLFSLTWDATHINNNNDKHPSGGSLRKCSFWVGWNEAFAGLRQDEFLSTHFASIGCFLQKVHFLSSFTKTYFLWLLS